MAWKAAETCRVHSLKVQGPRDSLTDLLPSREKDWYSTFCPLQTNQPREGINNSWKGIGLGCKKSPGKMMKKDE